MMTTMRDILSIRPAPGAGVRRRGCTRRRGTVLIVTMTIVFTLASVVLVLSRRMAVEALASANEAASIQASAVERGAEQYVLSLLTTNGVAAMDPTTFTEDYFYAVPVGGAGWFFMLRPQYDEDDLPLYGLVDESSKLDINIATYDQLMWLPGMTDEVASAIIDWRDTDDDVYNNGAESQYYLTLPEPYYCKNLPFDTVSELLMVRGVFREYLYGDGTALPLGSLSNTLGSGGSLSVGDPQLARGWYDLLTVNAYSPNTNQGGGGATGPARGLINVNTAPRAVLQALGVDSSVVEAIIAQRSSQSVMGTTDTSWLSSAMGNTGQIASLITGESQRYSADILAVSRNGRAFKRVRIVVDSTTTPMSIIFRRDITEQGWPMDPELLASIRSSPDNWAGTSSMGGVQR